MLKFLNDHEEFRLLKIMRNQQMRDLKQLLIDLKKNIDGKTIVVTLFCYFSLFDRSTRLKLNEEILVFKKGNGRFGFICITYCIFYV